MKRFDSRALVGHAVLAAIPAAGLGAIFGSRGQWGAAAICLLLAMGYVYLRMGRYMRRARSGVRPAVSIVKHIEAGVDFYHRLDPGARARFLRDAHYFLLEARIFGVNTEVSDEMRAYIAAAAAMLCHGRPDYEFDYTRDILIYPDVFDEDYDAHEDGDRAGEVGDQGPIVLSAPDLVQEFREGDSGVNVVVHELAHVLDFDNGFMDGVPGQLTPADERRWMKVMNDRLDAGFREGTPLGDLLGDYAYEDHAEFFACCTELYYELSDELERADRELFEALEAVHGKIPEPPPFAGEVDGTAGADLTVGRAPS